ncbi:hypothetical protein ACERZ8_14800 [Tateyamaria armeniaca]|uniref:DUF4239 domain-containing protein n=1 Tax=Tateyamaria armeniaca TaxID=2518930 RepID=A0ABW8UVB4_9RHOB
MYDIPTPIIALLLLAGMLIALAVGHALDRTEGRADDQTRAQSNTVQGALTGLLALLLGFTFSLALARHDDRSGHVVAEANAIGTAWLRTSLLPEGAQGAAQVLLRGYTASRVEAVEVAASEIEARDALIAKANATFDEVWRIASEVARAEKSPVVNSFVTSLNDMIDALAARDAAVNRHVPELVLFLMFGTFMVLAVIMGFTASQANTRPGVPAYAMMALIVVLVFIIIDLDRPRRGLIEIDQTPLVEVYDAMLAAQG